MPSTDAKSAWSTKEHNDLALTVAGHDAITPSLSDIWNTGFGWNSAAYDPSISSTSTAPTAGTIYAVAVPLRAGQTVSNIWFDVTTAGTSTVPTSITVGLANATTVLAVSAEQKSNAAWTTANTLGVISLGSTLSITTSGIYYALFLQVGAWGGVAHTLNRVAGPHNNTGGVLSYATGGTGQTVLPSAGAAITLVTTSGLRYWAATS